MAERAAFLLSLRPLVVRVQGLESLRPAKLLLEEGRSRAFLISGLDDKGPDFLPHEAPGHDSSPHPPIQIYKGFVWPSCR